MTKPRQKVKRRLEFLIPTGRDVYPTSDYYWGDVIKTPGILPTDSLIKFYCKEYTHREWDGYEDREVTRYQQVIIIERYDDETDDEYLQRMKNEERRKKETDEKDRLEYLRLKAKFENEKE